MKIVLSVVAVIVAGCVALVLWDHRPAYHEMPPVRAQTADPMPDGWDDTPSFDVLPLAKAIAMARSQFQGRPIAAALTPPTQIEAALNVQLVYDLRLLTPDGDVLHLRMDARDGRLLDIKGRDLTAARKDSRK